MFADLGQTPDEVAESFRRLGIRGVRNARRFLNPIVRFVRILHPDSVDADVIKDGVVRIVYRPGKIEEVPLPAPVLAFLEAFNRGDYPDLEVSDQSAPG